MQVYADATAFHHFLLPHVSISGRKCLMRQVLLLQADWFAKHRQQRPAVAAVFFER